MLHCRLKELLDLALALALISPILLNALLLESSLGIIVSGGLSSLSVELLLGDGSSCWLPSLPARRSGHSQSGLVICGGASEYLPGGEAATLTSCTRLEAGVWTSSHSLQQQRWGHLGWETEGGILLLGGEDTGARRTTELLTSTSSSTTEQYRLSYDTRYTMHKFIIRHI